MVLNKRFKLTGIVLGSILMLAFAGGFLLSRDAKQHQPTSKEKSVTTLQGILTQVFTDCKSSLRLSADGQIINDSPISCDGGSFIVLDNKKTIFTASGFTTPEYYYNKHDASWQPGQKVTAKALLDESGDTYTLNCADCSIKLN